MNIPKQLAAGVSGLDIIHGELKSLMYEQEQKLEQDLAEDDKAFHEGMLEAFAQVYALTYELSFAGAK